MPVCFRRRRRVTITPLARSPVQSKHPPAQVCDVFFQPRGAEVAQHSLGSTLQALLRCVRHPPCLDELRVAWHVACVAVRPVRGALVPHQQMARMQGHPAG